ncbi:MAG: creatininase family protein [Planctomycetota bacterium]
MPADLSPANSNAPSPRPWRLEELTLGDVRELDCQVAVLPMGATEPHNLHLPYGTDSYEGWFIADRCCAKATELGGRVLQLPVIPYGTETNLREFPLAINLQPSTLNVVLQDIVDSLEQSGIQKLVILNSHGGNDFKPFLREMYGQTEVQLFLCNWYQMIADVVTEVCEHAEDHAGEMETSLIMMFRPDLVKYSGEQLAADAGDRRPLRFEALRNGWVGLSRPWHLLTSNSGSGNPHAATADKGARLLGEIVQRVAPFLAELSEAEIDEFFPFEANE